MDAHTLPLPQTPLQELFADYTAADVTELADTALAPEGEFGPGILLQFATLRLATFVDDVEVRKIAQRAYPLLSAKYLEQHPEPIWLAPAIQAIVMKDEGGVVFDFSTLGDPGTDWADAKELLYAIDEIGENASRWIHDPRERDPHLVTVFGLGTEVLSAVERRVWRQHIARRQGTTDDPQSDAVLKSELAPLARLTKTAQGALVRAAEHSAQSAYTLGVFIGGAALLGLTLLIAAALYIAKLPAIDVIALPAGGIGGTLSVMNRLHSNSLKLEYQSSHKRLTLFGALRPWIGGVFGMVVFAIIESTLLTTIQVPGGTGPQVAFFALLGFLSGFNERFAHDFMTRVGGELGPDAASPAGRNATV